MKIEKIGLKDDKDKLRLDLIPPFVILELGKTLTYGAKKYKPNSWQNVPGGRDTHYAAAMRHILAWRQGELYDKESGLMHLTHALSNIMFMMYHDIEANDDNNSK